MSHPLSLRLATLSDLGKLEVLENRVFDTDRLTRRSLRYFILNPKAAMIVACRGDHLAGYALLTFRSRTALARLYSIAVSPETGRSGVGRALMQTAEKAAIERDCILLRLEVRADNHGAIALYEKLGYRQFGVYERYYEDDQKALRLEKLLVAQIAPPSRPPPYYRQTSNSPADPHAFSWRSAGPIPSFTQAVPPKFSCGASRRRFS